VGASHVKLFEETVCEDPHEPTLLFKEAAASIVDWLGSFAIP